jgi:hypothetical protein
VRIHPAEAVVVVVLLLGPDRQALERGQSLVEEFEAQFPSERPRPFDVSFRGGLDEAVLPAGIP